MEIIELNDKNIGEWNDFCHNSDDAWFWHSTHWLKYTLNYKPDFKQDSFSFFLKNHKEIEAIFPLILETHYKEDEEFMELSFGGAPTPVPALKNQLSVKTRVKRLKLLFTYIDELAKEKGVHKTSFRFTPLSPSYYSPNLVPYNYLMRFGYTPISMNTQMINLSKNINELWADLRHGHKSNINRGLKQMKVEIFHKENIRRPIFDEYQHLHHRAARRITRPQITFDLMYSWILQGNATLVAASFNDEYIGFSYIFTYKKCAYFGSACNNPCHSQKPIGHILQWKIIHWLKEHEYKYYEIGPQQYHPLPYDLATKKELNISFYKRGFGGYPVPLYMGEKYFSRDYYLSINQDRINRYANLLNF